MKDKDFRVGDIVCSFDLGTGIVTNKHTSGPFFSIEVKFHNFALKKDFNLDGTRKVGGEVYTKLPSLMHGTWEQVFGQIQDVKPVRKIKKYVNLYEKAVKDSYIFGDVYNSKEEALENATKHRYNVAIAVEIEVEE